MKSLILGFAIDSVKHMDCANETRVALHMLCFFFTFVLPCWHQIFFLAGFHHLSVQDEHGTEQQELRMAGTGTTATWWSAGEDQRNVLHKGQTGAYIDQDTEPEACEFYWFEMKRLCVIWSGSSKDRLI